MSFLTTLQRTERIKREAMRPMKPEEFAKILCEKLEKVIIDRESAEKAMREADAEIVVSILIFAFLHEVKD